MKVWITKSALTSGIQEREARYLGGDNIAVKAGAHGRCIYYFGRLYEWHLTKEAAIKRAESMRDDAIQELRRTSGKAHDFSRGMRASKYLTNN